MNPAMWISKTGVQAQDAKLQAIARELGCNRSSVYRLMEAGKIANRQDSGNMPHAT